ncbi:hypothetical protein GALL_168040 [mine drainage metagenome]|uniref:Uncharacterized protein n=1 Tax=mine drainage metagenome TaxID=410659 RepID=A0A1J5RZ84_9ZZZZ
MPNETIITDGYQLANKTVRLNFTVRSYHNAFLDLNKWSYKSIVTNCAFIQIAWLNNFYVFSKHNITNTCFIYFVFIHRYLAD